MKWNEKTESLEFDDFGDGSVEIQTGHKVMYVAAVNRELKKWFDKQIRVKGYNNGIDFHWQNLQHNGDETHKAILIGVTKIEEETAEDVLRALLDCFSEFHFESGGAVKFSVRDVGQAQNAMLKAKRLLEKK